MRIGLIARCDDTGLGNQTYEFYKHMKPSKVMCIDFQDYNEMPQHTERYPGAQVVRGFPKEDDIDTFLRDLDVVFTCEIPYNYRIFELAKQRGIKTVLQYNFEFLDYLKDPSKPLPDLFASPTTWGWGAVPFDNKMILKVPVNRQAIPFRSIAKARTFLHVVGRPAAEDRNGTLTFINALVQMREPVKALFFTQNEAYAEQITACIGGANIPSNVTTEVRHGNMLHYGDLYKEGDVLVMPRRFGGLCLPMQEALSAGMPVIMPDISPNGDMLPKEWLVPARIKGTLQTRTLINVYDADEHSLASKMTWFAQLSPKRMLEQNARASGLAGILSWERQQDIYMEAFERLCNQ